MSRYTYVTPRNAAMACLNAIAEIRAAEADSGRVMASNEQVNVILLHLRDFLGGRIFLMQFRRVLSVKSLIDLVCDDAECMDELKSEIRRRAS